MDAFIKRTNNHCHRGGMSLNLRWWWPVETTKAAWWARYPQGVDTAHPCFCVHTDTEGQTINPAALEGPA